MHSLAYLKILTTIISQYDQSTPNTLPAELRPDGTLFLKIVLFLESFDSVQIRYAGHQWRRVVKFVYRITQLFNVVMLA